MIGFGYHSEILDRFPEVCGGVLLLSDVSNGPASDGLLAEYTLEQNQVKERTGDKPLSDLESLAAWRVAFRGFGVDPTKYRCAAEALLRRLIKKGDIPSINTLVDICNLVSIRYALPVAAFETRHIRGLIMVRFAEGIENFMPLDQAELEHPVKGEVIFCDEMGLVIARRWCWKQSLESVVLKDTRNAIVTIEAQHSMPRASIEAAVRDVQVLVGRYAGGRVQTGLVGKDRAVFISE